MRAAGEDGKGDGADLALSEADLAKLLDRTHVFADDLASGADAGGWVGGMGAGWLLDGAWWLIAPCSAGVPFPQPTTAVQQGCLQTCPPMISICCSHAAG